VGLAELWIFRSSIKLLERSSGVSLKPSTLLFRRRSLSGSPIGGIPETQEMLDFCGEHNIAADVEVIPIQKVNEAYERLLKSDVKYRFSIDMASLRSE
jgi:alcohol dehydrogenase (NADP+)